MLVPLLFSGCTVDAPIDSSWSDGKADSPLAGGVTPTQAPDAMALAGYARLLDATTDSCLVPSNSSPAYTVGAIDKPLDLTFVSSKQDLARTLGIDASVKVGAFGPAVDFLDTFKQSRSAIHLVLAMRGSYRVTNTRSVALTPDALGWLTTDPRTFLHRCGEHYINGVQYEAQLFLLIRFEGLTDDAVRTLDADLGISGATAALGLDANVKAKLENLAKRQDVSVSLHVLDRGFLTTGNTGDLVASLLGSGLSADTFTKLDSIRTTMLASIADDATRDGNYFANTSRLAIPAQLDLRPYSRASNAPLGGTGSPYETMHALVAAAEHRLNVLGHMSTRLHAVADDEIAGFLAAPDKTIYGVAPPGAPVLTIDGLITLANQAHDELVAAMSPVDAMIDTCWNQIGDGAYEECADDPTSSPELGAANAAIADYAARARIVPAAYSSAGVLGWNGAHDACATAGLRLPSFDEAKRLAIPIGFGKLPRTTETRLEFAAWHTDTSNCGTGYPAFANPPGATICTDDDWFNPHPVTTLCVPGGGPFDQLAAP